jgi:hypothetical protein
MTMILAASPRTEPDDRERDPGQRRDRPQQQEDRVDERLDLAARAHREAERDAERRRDDEAHRHQQHAAQHVLVQARVAVALDDDLLQGRGDFGRRREARRRDHAEDGRQQVPEQDHAGQDGERMRQPGERMASRCIRIGAARYHGGRPAERRELV